MQQGQGAAHTYALVQMLCTVRANTLTPLSSPISLIHDLWTLTAFQSSIGVKPVQHNTMASVSVSAITNRSIICHWQETNVYTKSSDAFSLSCKS